MGATAGFCTTEAESTGRRIRSPRSSLPKRIRPPDTVSTQRRVAVCTETNSMDATTATRALRYLTNEEAAMFLKLSPRTLDKFRVLGGGPKFRKFGRRVIYALDDLENGSARKEVVVVAIP